MRHLSTRQAGYLFGALCMATLPRAASAAPFAYNETSVILTGVAGKQLKSPEGVACRGDGDLLIADTGNRRLVRYAYKNNQLLAQTMPALRAGIRPTRVEFDPKGNIVVLDGVGRRRIVRLDKKGAFVGVLQLSGAAMVKDAVFGSFKIDSAGNFYILNLTKPNVLVTDSTGKFQRAIDLPGEEPVYTDLAVSSSGAVFVLTGASTRIYQARPGAQVATLLTTTLPQFMSFGSHLALDPTQKTLIVVDQHGDRVVLVGTDGRYLGRKFGRGWRKGFLHLPAQACVTKGGNLLVADRANHRVQFFTVR